MEGINDMYGNEARNSINWVVKDDDISDDSTSSSIGSISEDDDDSMNSECSSSFSSELAEDASSSTSSSHDSNGPLYELSELMNHLPIKRGLSMFYQGKAQSFTSLGRVQSIEDLPKKEIPYNRKKMIKSCKSYGGGLDGHRVSSYTSTPKATISKKPNSKGSNNFVSHVLSTKRRSFLGDSTLCSISLQKNF